jgi:hypothetical protein
VYAEIAEKLESGYDEKLVSDLMLNGLFSNRALRSALLQMTSRKKIPTESSTHGQPELSGDNHFLLNSLR